MPDLRGRRIGRSAADHEDGHVKPELSEHLFRRESGRLVAALTRIFGVHNLALAEDVVQDAFCRALEVWKVRGIPDNPGAWLMAVAKHRALDIVRRERTARTFAPELTRVLESEWTLAPAVEEAFAGSTIRDEQLRMMFSCCDPRLPEEAQVALVLNILCGFGAGEIASAFLVSRAAMEKRITRGKKTLAASARLFDLADAEFAPRLSAVRRALYLLFNEGYHGASAQGAVRTELCTEAIRLTLLLIEASQTASPETFALAALMYLNAAKLPARLDTAGDLNPLVEHDRARWDTRLVQQGLELLDRSASGDVISAFHVEAAIAAVHATAQSIDETDWNTIVGLYDRLMTIAPSPIVALNRAIAIGQRDGPDAGIDALRAIGDLERLRSYPFYPAALGELERRRGNLGAASGHFATAAALARNDAERRFLEKRIRDCA
ncbi:MAG: sigma factor, ECF subfamily protein [Acidobacteria bacterium]|nr:MAG: sigma factor, ECF subfamily protein [Acidobacteriota bacterium]